MAGLPSNSSTLDISEPTVEKHNSIDRTRIFSQVSREPAGICNESTLWNEWSAQCKEALAEYTERDYTELFLDTDHADVTILCKDESFPAHKTVLCNRSPVFKKMLSQDLETKETVTINDFEPEVIKLFLKFMYSGELGLTQESWCNSLFELALTYQVGALRMLCEHQLTDKVTIENCIKYWEKSEEMDAPLLWKKCRDTASENSVELLRRHEVYSRYISLWTWLG